jgi:hypothetical protein
LREEKSDLVKQAIGKCLSSFIRETMNYSNMHASFELLFSVCLKGFEETDEPVHSAYVQACYELLNLRL